MSDRKRWAVRQSAGFIHVYPLDDWQDHSTYGYQPCKCKPRPVNEDGTVIFIHNAFDGREMAEKIEELKGSGKVLQ